MSIRVVLGEIDAKDATTRAVIPSAAQPRWPPLERIAETIATPRRRFPPHGHEGVEVMTYVIEGAGTYEYGPGGPSSLTSGSTTLLTAPAPVAHAINPGKGQTVRWFAAIASLPAGKVTEPRIQSSSGEVGGEQADGTAARRLVGPGTTITSAVGLECDVIEYRSAGATFRKVGRDRIGVCYALSGRGSVDNAVLEAGAAALIENAAGIALQGRPGFHVVLVTAPRGS